MFYTLNSGYSGSEILPIKSWLNVLVKSRPNLDNSNKYDGNMTDVVRQFQIQNKAPFPDGTIDNITFYNIVRRIDPAVVNRAAQQNVALKMMLSNMALVYDDEVHKNLTYALALAAGFNALDADTIAYTDVHRDYDADSNPLPQGKADVASGANKRRLAAWHFVTPERLKEIDGIWRNSGNIVDLGKFMHTFQDTFSHKGLGPWTGQVGTRVDENGEAQRDSTTEAEWHQVDDPSRRPELAKDMAKQSYDKLVEAAGIIYLKKPDVTIIYPPVGWSAIASEVSDFCTDSDAKSREARADKLAKRLEANQRKLTPIK